MRGRRVLGVLGAVWLAACDPHHHEGAGGCHLRLRVVKTAADSLKVFTSRPSSYSVDCATLVALDSIHHTRQP